MAPRSVLMLQQQLKELHKKPPEFFSAGLADEGNLFEWDVCLTGPPDTLYEGGIFNCKLIFPESYPDRPPKMKFITPIWHPNVYPNGDVCISILHEPGDDVTNPQETAAMRWNPVHTVETIVISVISMLSDPTDESPANLDAAKEFREDFASFKRKAAKCVARSLEFD